MQHNGYKCKSIKGSAKHFIREDGVKLTKRANGTFREVHGATSRSGYTHLTIDKVTYTMHRLVAEAFLPNPDNLPVVDHINNISTDNRVENLRWSSYKDNAIAYNTEQKGKTITSTYKENKLIATIKALEATVNELTTKLQSTEKSSYYKDLLRQVLLGNPIPQEIIDKLQLSINITVNGLIFGGTSSAATYITAQEKVAGNIRNKETINKEIKRLVKTGKTRLMYNKYTINTYAS